MGGRSLSEPVIALLAAHGSKRFADRAAWTAHLEDLGITALDIHPDPVKIATEGALWGSVTSHRLLKDAVIVSDDAGQFNGKRSFKPWTGPTSGSSSTSNRGSTRGLVTRFALRYRRSHGGSRGRFRHRPDAGRG